MGIPQLFTWLVTTGLISVAAMVAGLWISNVTLVVAAALMFTAVAGVVGWRLNAAFRDIPHDRVTPEAAPIAARRNARLCATIYAWGGGAMLGSYYLTDLHWQHAWQYGAAMLLIAASLWLYSTALGDPKSAVRTPRWLLAVQRLTQLQAIAALAGMGFIIVAGKLTAAKSDWAANVIFLAGGVALALISAIAVRTQRRLMRTTG